MYDCAIYVVNGGAIFNECCLVVVFYRCYPRMCSNDVHNNFNNGIIVKQFLCFLP